jgi:hypothetical protein
MQPICRLLHPITQRRANFSPYDKSAKKGLMQAAVSTKTA